LTFVVANRNANLNPIHVEFSERVVDGDIHTTNRFSMLTHGRLMPCGSTLSAAPMDE
jgi:hypothetical protein